MTQYLFAILIGAAEPEASSAVEVLEKAVEAMESAYQSLTSGVGRGVLERIWPDGNLRAEIALAFDRPKNFVLLKYKHAPGVRAKYDAEVMIDDGSVVYRSVFSPRIPRTGAEGFLRELSRHIDPTGSFPPEVLGFSPDFLVQSGVYPAKRYLEYSERRQPVTFEITWKDTLALIVARRKIDDDIVVNEFWVDTTMGHHIVRHRLLVNDDVRVEIVRKMDRKDGVWFVRELSSRGVAVPEEFRLVLHDFNPNASVPGELFTVESLALPAGARLIDRRPGFNPDRVIRWQSGPGDLGRFAEYVGELPRAHPRPRVVRKPVVKALPTSMEHAGPRAFYWAALGCGIVIAGGGLVVYLKAVRAKKHS